MIEDIRETLNKGKEEILNKHIPEVTNKIMDVYELGLTTGNKLGELNMLTKVITYMKNIGCSDELISKIYNNVK
jgi:hypothetical protein